jgi:hypothetical protein
MATTIITKHGTGAPTSLAVGELAIDKSGPTLYTNTGGGVEAFSSDGGGGGAGIFVGQAAPFNYDAVTYGGTLAAQCSTGAPLESGSAISEKLGFTINKPNSLVWGDNDNLIITAPPGTAFKVFINLTSASATTFQSHRGNSTSVPLNRGSMINIGNSGNDIEIKWNFRAAQVSNAATSAIRSSDSTAELLTGTFYICTGVEIRGPIGGGATSKNAFTFSNFQSVYI